VPVVARRAERERRRRDGEHAPGVARVRSGCHFDRIREGDGQGRHRNPRRLPRRLASATPAPAEILVIVAHPELEQSRANRRLLDAARALQATSAPGRLAVRDLYALYPDYLIDVGVEQAALAAARLVVWQQPIHWYGMPPLLKLWLDEVLTFGWAYGPAGTALKGKDLWLVASTGGPEDSYRPESYNRYFFDAFMPPYEQTAALCGMRFLPPLMLHGAHKASEAAIRAHAEVYAQRLLSHPDWPEIEDLPEGVACDVPLTSAPSTPHASLMWICNSGSTNRRKPGPAVGSASWKLRRSRYPPAEPSTLRHSPIF
jgi:glutathione-regulated potassium-efflux system ancillary protein KefF